MAYWNGFLSKELVRAWERFAWKQMGTLETPTPETTLEAEVQCAYCKQRRWVGWDIRHDGKNPTAMHHKLARCPNCPVGQDRTVYTGRCRGQVESKRPD